MPGFDVGNALAGGSAPATKLPMFTKPVDVPQGGLIKPPSIWDNPEMMMIVADMVGSKIAPNNPFAGVGGMLGQSSLANKKVNESNTDMQSFILKALGIADNKANPDLASVLGSLTGKQETGPTDLKITRNDDGTLSYSSTGNLLGLDKMPALSAQSIKPTQPTLGVPMPGTQQSPAQMKIQQLGLRPIG